jgi:putative endonuclease
MGMYRKILGESGEDSAVRYLKKKGYDILDRNIRIGRGELDIIASENDLIVFVEVKTRSCEKYLDLFDSISESKAETLIQTCELYLEQNGLSIRDFRIDLIGILLIKGIVTKIKHVEGIV